MKLFFFKIHWILSSQFGFDLKRFFLSLRGIPVYLRDFLIFRKNFSGKVEITPCLYDRYEQGGDARSEYFWQDLLVARAIYIQNPVKHVDIGSRVDGFVAHIASFREIEVFDVRPITSKVPGVVFKQADLMSSIASLALDGKGAKGYCDSISCLHALEHFGLGRYGDPINSRGYLDGIENIAKLLCPNGTLYLSTPIGRERVEFNANWVFNPTTIINSIEAQGMMLKNLIIITSKDGYSEVEINHKNLYDLSKVDKRLGLFTFVKN